MEKDESLLKREFVRIARRIYQRGLQGYTGGNLSVRVPGQERIIIKRSGLSFVDCLATNLVMVDLLGKVVEGEGKPSKEVFAHLGVYRARDDVGAVLHIHPPWATALAVMGVELPLLTVQAIEKLRRVPLVPFAPQGSNELSELVTTAFQNDRVVAALLERHGIITAGPTLSEALNTAELVEETAQVGWLALYGRASKA
ncbi:MAG: class II aldolase/adducin family protein [Chloroflexi bacterium]|nr:class II aldolase/adducin family protein [Chloroflexota bacterium]